MNWTAKSGCQNSSSITTGTLTDDVTAMSEEAGEYKAKKKWIKPTITERSVIYDLRETLKAIQSRAAWTIGAGNMLDFEATMRWIIQISADALEKNKSE
jgi:hypothetical protein